ncbi:hypothetical protein DM02DRAFT_508975, partial [Periconia macrospinosa]
KFRKTKLAALLADPASFSASHGDEVLLPLEVWTQRLARPCTVFICVAGGDGGGYEEDEEEALMEREWVGMVTLRGPFSYELYRLSGPESPVRVEVEEEEEEGEDPETRWHLSNLWTSSAHRGRGLAKKMVQECLDFATSESKRLPGKDKARVRLIIKDEGSFLKRMYARMGFDETGRASLREAYIASGDEGCLPRDTSSKEELIGLWETRFGLVMERVL